MNAPSLVIGLGNPERGDDAAGWAFVDLLASQTPEPVRLLRLRGEAAGLLDALQQSPRVWLVDAVCSGAVPGTLHWLDVHAGPLPADWFSRMSTHDFGLPEAVELGRTLDLLPQSLNILGIEGASFDPGAPLSPAVAEALPAAVRHLLERLNPRSSHA